VTAGLLALSLVASFVVLLGALLDWFGWLASVDDSAFRGFRVSLLFLELALVVSAAVALRLFEFPLLVFVVAASTWFFLSDLASGCTSCPGLTIGGGLLWFFHDGDWEWILVAIAGLLYVAVGDRLLRSSWVVLGGWGILQAAAHFAAKWSEECTPWRSRRSTSSRSCSRARSTRAVRAGRTTRGPRRSFSPSRARCSC